MIYTVTFNPALDYYMDINSLNIGETNRSLRENIRFGGKGINVSYVLNQLGIKSVALGFVAGFTGEALEKELLNSGIVTDFIKLDSGITRINVKLRNESITEINASGPTISEKALKELFLKLDNIKSGDVLVLSGSVPSTMPADIYEQILEHIINKKVRTVVDASGRLMVNSLKYKPFLIKPNRAELEEICNKTLKTDDDIISAAKNLQNLGAQNVLVSLGGDGALLLDENDNTHRVFAHKITAVNTVGAGDSMVAGFIAGVDKGYNYAIQLSNAAGGATASLQGLATKKDIFALL